MRDILFRGKHMYNGKWACGSIVHQTDHYGVKVDRWFLIDGTETNDYDIGQPLEVFPETVGQYTGAIDKNNRKMFEGDIVEDICGGIGTIVYQKDECAFYVDLGDTYDTVDGKLYTVIGNVYDNPELLEGENQ